MPRTYRFKPLLTAPPPIRAQVYVKDPLVSERSGVDFVTLELAGESWLGAGPTSARIEVRDEREPSSEDDDFQLLAEPVEPLARGGGFAAGNPRRRDNYKHHQVNVWAHSQRTLALLEDARVLGRRVAWAFPGGRLVIRPHAFEDENAYYDRALGAIHFGHYTTGAGRGARNVYACLSHDVIVHELGHAILDGLKPLYYELDSPDVAGFHEYFGDALAMVSSLTMREVVLEVVRDRSSRLSVRNLVSDIALEFGSQGRGHQPLRSAGNVVKMGHLRNKFEEHDFSEVLTGVFYDLLRALYADSVPRRAIELGKPQDNGQVVVGALISAAERTSRMMLRALDYCPPCGLSYLDYARAIHRSDEVAYPVDDRGYRRILTRVLKLRGVIRSARELVPERAVRNADLRAYDVDRLAASPTDAYSFLDANRGALEIPRTANFTVTQLYRTQRISSGRHYPPREIVIEYAWPNAVTVPRAVASAMGESSATIWCGGALVFDTNGNVLYHAAKGLPKERLARFKWYLERLMESGALGSEFDVRRVDGRTTITRKARMRHRARGDRR
jgi:hypothetical protein